MRKEVYREIYIRYDDGSWEVRAYSDGGYWDRCEYQSGSMKACVTSGQIKEDRSNTEKEIFFFPTSD